jgi:PhnB protein
MAQTHSHVPTRYHSVTPYLIVSDVPALIDFLIKVFDAEEVMRDRRPDGSAGHAEVRVGDSIVMMGGSTDAWNAIAAALYVYVPDVDATYRRALEAGATSLSEPEDKDYGDRTCGVKDASGTIWWIGTHGARS